MTSSVRLTKDDRRSILRSALAPVFDKRAEDLDAQEDGLGRRCYDAVFPKPVREQAVAMPEAWLRRDSCLRFSVAGMQMVFRLKDDGVPVPGNHGSYCYRLGTVTDPKTVEAVRAWQSAKDDLASERSKAEAALKALLDSAYTVKALREAWPEGEAFYRHLDNTPPKAGLPAPLVSEINAMLGLPAREAA
ncbi:Nmad5 family putative nucleotide modification protein [Methylobacterium mesophilicum]